MRLVHGLRVFDVTAVIPDAACSELTVGCREIGA
jgi:hypothetical protein